MTEQTQMLTDEDFANAKQVFRNATKNFDTGDCLVVLFELCLEQVAVKDMSKEELREHFASNLECCLDDYFNDYGDPDENLNYENVIKLSLDEEEPQP